MKITEGRVIVTSPGRNFVTLRLETEDGLYGLGDATLNGRELAVAAYLNEHVIPALIGRDARNIEDIWQYLYKGAYWRRGPVTMSAVAAVDMALWDLAGKRLGVPVHELLGGRSRRDVMVYGHANGQTIEDTLEAVARYRDLGYKAIRAQCGALAAYRCTGCGRERYCSNACGCACFCDGEQGVPHVIRRVQHALAPSSSKHTHTHIHTHHLWVHVHLHMFERAHTGTRECRPEGALEGAQG